MPDHDPSIITSIKAHSDPYPPGYGSQACLVLIYPQCPLMGKRYPLEQNQIIIGRTCECDIVLDENSVSRRHAQVNRDGTVFWVADLKSTNGTYVNGNQVDLCALSDGDQIKIGSIIFKFLTGGNIEQSYHDAIYRMTIIDGLTTAYRKCYLIDFLEREIARSKRLSQPLSIVMYDFDNLSMINDTHGNFAGDCILQEITALIKEEIGRDELLARYGGEEFVIVLPGSTTEKATQFAENLRKLVESTPISFEGVFIEITISLGLATSHGIKLERESFIAEADKNLYAAKRMGGLDHRFANQPRWTSPRPRFSPA